MTNGPEPEIAKRGGVAAIPMWKWVVLSCLAVVPGIALWAHVPIPQDLKYHDFADHRTWLGIPNAWNVISNAPFLWVGIIGCLCGRRWAGKSWSWSWAAFFIGVTGVGFGSSYYHWAPSNASLVWDRWPMSVAFMGLFVALCSESIGWRWERPALGIALTLGTVSVWYWQRYDDLRLYAWVQYAPLLMLMALLSIFPRRYSDYGWIVGALICYVVAKLLEASDGWFYQLTGEVVAGHGPKHVVAALGCAMVLEMLRKRRALPPASAM